MPDVQSIFAPAGYASFGGTGVLVAIALLVTLRVLLPRADRPKLRLPLAFLVLNLALVLVRAAIPAHWPGHRTLEVTAAALILACIGRAGFLLGIDWLLGHRLQRPLSRIFRDIIQVIVYVGVGLLTLRAMGFDPGSLLTTSALLTAIIGLSLQETLGNLFAGLAIQTEHPFDLGDWILVEQDEAHAGKVTEINWRATKILTIDHVEVIVPNAVLARTPLRNFSQPTPISRRVVEVRAPYDVPPREVFRALVKSARGIDGVCARPAPDAQLCEFLESAVLYRVIYFIDRFDQRYAIDSAVRSRIWYALKRAGIATAFPVRDVRMTDVTTRHASPSIVSLEAEQALRSIDFLSVLPAELLSQLASRTEIMSYTAGEDIIVQGDEGHELFVILSGEAAVLVGAQGGPQEVARLGPGKVFGEMSLMTGEPRNATVRAVAECQVIVVGHDAFRQVLSTAPDLAGSMSRILAKRQIELEAHAQSAEAPGAAESARGQALLGRIKAFFSI